jgi:hypothetical protein
LEYSSYIYINKHIKKMKTFKILTLVAFTLLTSCSTIKSSLNDWKSEIKEDIRTGNDFNQLYSSVDNVALSLDQPKSKVEIDWYQQRMDYWKKYGYSYYTSTYYTRTYYTPTLNYSVAYTSWGGKYYIPIGNWP